MGKVVYYDNFYTASGLLIGQILGTRSLEYRKRVVNDYHRFVETNGGKFKFASVEEAIERFLNEPHKGERDERRRRR